MELFVDALEAAQKTGSATAAASSSNSTSSSTVTWSAPGS